MIRIPALALLLLVSACATFALGPGAREREALWKEAHFALQAEEFRAADTLFARLAELHPETREGREAIFYLGAIRLDPRHPEWSARAAERALRRYVALADTVDAERIARRPEAMVFLQLAEQLNLPVAERIPALQPDTVVRVVEGETRRVVAPAAEARALAAEAERLRRELAARETTIRELRDELERIRKTLAPGRRP